MSHSGVTLRCPPEGRDERYASRSNAIGTRSGSRQIVKEPQDCPTTYPFSGVLAPAARELFTARHLMNCISYLEARAFLWLFSAGSAIFRPLWRARLLAAQAKDSTDPATLLDDIPAKWPLDDWCRP